MKKITIFLFFVTMLASCQTRNETQFSKEALNDVLISSENSEITFQQILNKYKGKRVLIDVWAGWCGDCVRGLPKVKKIQQEYKDIVFVFLSVDRSYDSWRNSINRFDVQGEHYFLPKGMSKGDFVSFLGLNWVPRYMLINADQSIEVFNVITADDERLLLKLKKA